jgi:hypothetical protein
LEALVPQLFQSPIPHQAMFFSQQVFSFFFITSVRGPGGAALGIDLA